MNTEDFDDLYDLAHLLISKVSWYTEAARLRAHEMIDKARTAAALERRPTNG